MEVNLQKSIESIQHSHLIGLSLVNFIILHFTILYIQAQV